MKTKCPKCGHSWGSVRKRHWMKSCTTTWCDLKVGYNYFLVAKEVKDMDCKRCWQEMEIHERLNKPRASSTRSH